MPQRSPLRATPSPSYISNLSNEVLDVILSFIPMDDIVSNDGQRTSQITVLLHVSRRFRRAVLRSKHCLGFGFDFRTLQHEPTWTPDCDSAEKPVHPVNDLIANLFGDDDFCHALEAKTEWAIPPFCPELLLGAATHVPSFSQNLRKFWQCGNFCFAVRSLTLCANVVELGILDDMDRRGHVDMTTIADIFPNVQHLYLALSTWSSGNILSLQRLSSFELLVVNDRDISSREPFKRGYFLPFGSASILTTLRLYGHTIGHHWDVSLNPFTALQHLKISYHGSGGWNGLLASVSAKLVSLEIQVFTDAELTRNYNDGRAEDLSLVHDCLSELQSIVIEAVLIYGDTNWTSHVQRCTDLLDTITRALPDVESITMEYAALDLEHIDCLKRLRNLKRLDWILETEYDCVGDPEQYEGPAEDYIARMFEDRPVKPQIHVRTHEELSDRPEGLNSRWPLHSSWYARTESRWPLHIDPLIEDRQPGW
jgi:hypothetical protein